ncbi:MAG: hypothetical protein LBC77_04930 [Spirochaetaceae bacterium]|nr:hypothetical protein [Spirochaetaceae bacterium]
MTLKELFTLSCKYLFRYRRRYLFLFSALCFGFAIITMIISFKAGISENLYTAAQSHYTGDIIFTGYDSETSVYRRLDAARQEAIYESVAESGAGVKSIVKRTLLNDEGMIFFNGESVTLRYLNGVDWNDEKNYFDKLNYTEHSAGAPDGDSIIISSQVAALLGARTGDSITLELPDRSGQANSWVFIVHGIVRDETLFGFYKAYISRVTMNYLLSYDEGDCSSIGVFLKSRASAGKDLRIMRSELSKKTLTAPEMTTYKEFKERRREDYHGVKIFVLTLSVYLTDLYQLIDALNLLVVLLYVIMLLIILSSAGVTYNLILHERLRELGTMMSIGFYEKDLRRLLGMETAVLGTIAIGAGCALSVLLCASLGMLPLGNLPSFEILLSNGRLRAGFDPLAIILNIMSLYAMLFIAVSIPAARTVRAPLTELLSGGVKGS